MSLNEQSADPESSSAWALFGSYEKSTAFLGAWLTLQCEALPGAERGWLFMTSLEDDTLAPVPMTYPPGASKRRDTILLELAEQAKTLRQGIVQPVDEDIAATYLVYPISTTDNVVGVVIVRLSGDEPERCQAAMQQLQWGAGWVLDWSRRQTFLSGRSEVPDASEIFQLFAGVMENPRFRDACVGLTSHLAELLSFDSVSLGFTQRGRVKIVSVSHGTHQESKRGAIRDLEAAMTEAIDQRSVVSVPSTAFDDGVVSVKHQVVLDRLKEGGLATFPLTLGEDIVGALTVEKRTPLTSRDRDMCDAIAALAGPALAEKRQNDRILPVKIADTIANQLGMLLGPRHLIRKVVLLAALGLVIFALYAEGTYTVSTPVKTEAKSLRVIAAPHEGYLQESDVRPGDVVKAGTPLAIFDTDDLIVERFGIEADLKEAQIEYKEAMAEYKLGDAKVAMAEADRLKARLKLIDSKLERATIRAPIDGLIVSGDLSQSIGEPIPTGEELFTLAPAGQYRLVAQVDERDIAAVKAGQTGQAVLAALPDETFQFEIKKVTPVLEAKDGRNYYRVEASFDQVSDRFRPGLEGRGRIDAGDRNLFWIWTHQLVSWVRLQAWAWLP